MYKFALKIKCHVLISKFSKPYKTEKTSVAQSLVFLSKTYVTDKMLDRSFQRNRDSVIYYVTNT